MRRFLLDKDILGAQHGFRGHNWDMLKSSYCMRLARKSDTILIRFLNFALYINHHGVGRQGSNPSFPNTGKNGKSHSLW
jgi:hypothetical protein